MFGSLNMCFILCMVIIEEVEQDHLKIRQQVFIT